MAVVYRPHTVREYHQIQRRLREVHQRYEDITDEAERQKYHEENWADLKAVIEPPPINALMLEEFMESYERFSHHFASAIQEFGKIPEGKDIPHNAITLWKAMIHGFDRVADALTKPPEK